MADKDVRRAWQGGLMPWQTTSTVEARKSFIEAYLEEEETFTELCQRFGISRQSGYKWVERFEDGGQAALDDRSRRPLTNSRSIAPSVVELIVAMRKKRPRWGPRKLLVVLEREYPDVGFPVASTVGEILHAKGLVSARRRRSPTVGYGPKLSDYAAPNAVWCADFKGHFLVGDRYCSPLTITDGSSRYLIRCEALPSTVARPVQNIFIEAFTEFGLPVAIRTDNGPPFASVAIGGLSPLAVWWIQLGILPERIYPGRPDQNGRHERMHRTLKAETAKPPQRTFSAQQRAFNAFRDDYNYQRPHEAIGQKVPAELYTTSRRRYTGELRDPKYPSTFTVHRAYSNGVISFNQTQWYLSHSLADQLIGVESVEDGCWKVHFGPITLGLIDLRGTVKKNSRRFGRLVRLPTDPRRRRPKPRR
jgi:putative transposase